MRITLPVVTPAILSGAVLTFVRRDRAVCTPVLAGLAEADPDADIADLSGVAAGAPAYGVMAVLAIYLMILSTLVVMLQQRLMRGRSFVTVTGKGFSHTADTLALVPLRAAS